MNISREKLKYLLTILLVVGSGLFLNRDQSEITEEELTKIIEEFTLSADGPFENLNMYLLNERGIVDYSTKIDSEPIASDYSGGYGIAQYRSYVKTSWMIGYDSKDQNLLKLYYADPSTKQIQYLTIPLEQFGLSLNTDFLSSSSGFPIAIQVVEENDETEFMVYSEQEEKITRIKVDYPNFEFIEEYDLSEAIDQAGEEMGMDLSYTDLISIEYASDYSFAFVNLLKYPKLEEEGSSRFVNFSIFYNFNDRNFQIIPNTHIYQVTDYMDKTQIASFTRTQDGQPYSGILDLASGKIIDAFINNDFTSRISFQTKGEFIFINENYTNEDEIKKIRISYYDKESDDYLSQIFTMPINIVLGYDIEAETFYTYLSGDHDSTFSYLEVDNSISPELKLESFFNQIVDHYGEGITREIETRGPGEAESIFKNN